MYAPHGFRASAVDGHVRHLFAVHWHQDYDSVGIVGLIVLVQGWIRYPGYAD